MPLEERKRCIQESEEQIARGEVYSEEESDRMIDEIIIKELSMHHEDVTSFKEKDYYTVEEFMDKLAKDLGRHYGLNDIREAL